MGFTFTFNGPATAEEIGRITGNPNAAAEAFMQQYCYQDRNVQFRDKFVEAVAAHIGEGRKSHEATLKSGESKTVYDETEQDYFNRVKAEGKLSDEDASRIANEVNQSIGDYSPSVGSDRKPAKKFYDDADAILAKVAAGESTSERVIANLESKMSISFESQFGDWSRDNLARALKALSEWKERQTKNELL